MASMRAIRCRVEAIGRLPIHAATKTGILDLLSARESAVSDISALVETDPGLAAMLLRLANSPYHGFTKQIPTIQFAMLVAGVDAVRDLLLQAAAADNTLDAELPGEQFDTFHRHSAWSGVAARHLAREVGYRVVGEAGATGLLHDMGVLVLLSHFPDEYQEITKTSNGKGISFLEAEQRVLGVTHADIGGWLAGRWNFPDHVTEGILLHHNPSNAKQNPVLSGIIYCADLTAHSLVASPSRLREESGEVPAVLRQFFRNNAAAYEEFLGKCRADLSALAPFDVIHSAGD